ncbi:MAG: UvrD-helicase domain-containing protein [Spirochaetaceae bacterium]|nr:UvrD-helicase domain-containing protein [Spirochaetaceae bacterium]
MIDLKNELNNEQYLGASTIEGPVLIIAGAGSGKTRMLTYRIAHMLESGIDAKNILALTFTNKAATEMSDRIDQLTKTKQKNLSSTTFHSFGLGLLKQHIQHLGWKNNFTIYDATDKITLIKQVVLNIGIPLDSVDVRELGEMISKVKTNRAIITEKTGEQTKLIISEYEKHLKAYNAVDFDDLIVKPQEIFVKFPDILDKTANQFQYILVDEFQDTSISQYNLIKDLAKKSRNLCVVGDDDQSIYSWRGANYQNIVMFEQDFPERKEIMLERNYRSSKTILEAANNLIINNKERKEKKLWTESNKGASIYLMHPSTGELEASLVTQQIIDQHLSENRSLSDFAILSRTNALIPSFEAALMERDIETRVTGTQSLFDRKETRDIISYLKVIANPDDDVNLLRIINTPRRGIGRITVEKLRKLADNRNMSLYSSLCYMATSTDPSIKEGTKKKLIKFMELIEYYTRKFEDEEGQRNQVLRMLIKSINYRDYLIELNDTEKAVNFKLKGIDILCGMLAKWERNPFNKDKDMQAWINRIALIGKENQEDNKGAVNLMTMHASKGLEFDTVFLVGIEDHIIPSQRSLEEDPKNIDEERRLFYVAITRAKRKLIISSCRKRQRGKDLILSLQSRFIDELPPALIDEQDPNKIASTTEIKSGFSALKERLARMQQNNEK